MNKAIIIGRLGKYPEIRITQSGSKIASFSVATNHSIKNENGKWEETTEWHNVVVFGKRAEFVEQYLQKGKRIYVEGRLQTNSWEDQNGIKRYKVEIIAADIQLLSSKAEVHKKDGNDNLENDTSNSSAIDLDDVPF